METRPVKEKQGAVSRFKRLAAWKKVALILGAFVVVVFVAAFDLALFSMLGLRGAVENTLAGGREVERVPVTVAPAASGFADGRSVFHVRAPSEGSREQEGVGVSLDEIPAEGGQASAPVPFGPGSRSRLRRDAGTPPRNDTRVQAPASATERRSRCRSRNCVALC